MFKLCKKPCKLKKAQANTLTASELADRLQSLLGGNHVLKNDLFYGDVEGQYGRTQAKAYHKRKRNQRRED